MIHRSRARRATLALLVALAAPRALPAQQSVASSATSASRDVWPVEFTPFVGAYVPLTDLARFSTTVLILGVPARVSLNTKQKNAFALGGRLSGWFNARFGGEGAFMYAWSDVNIARTIEIPGEVRRLDFTLGGTVWIASAKVLYRLARIDRSAVVLVGAGPAIIARGGEAYDAPAFGLAGAGTVSGTTDLGGVVDIGVRIDASSRIAIRLDAEAYLYSASIAISRPFGSTDAPDLKSDSRFQADLSLSAGLAIGLGP